MKKNLIILFFCLISFFSDTANAESIFSGFSLGFGYPYISLKYDINSQFDVETRYAFSENINIYGLRGYYSFLNEGISQNSVNFFSGLELDYTTFDDNISGGGIIAYPFIGGEYFFIDSFSLMMDFGPAFISLEEDEYNLTVDGFEWVVNMGMFFYFK